MPFFISVFVSWTAPTAVAFIAADARLASPYLASEFDSNSCRYLRPFISTARSCSDRCPRRVCSARCRRSVFVSPHCIGVLACGVCRPPLFDRVGI